jgi:hypothetical protein
MASIEKGAVANTEDMFAHAASIVQQNIYALDSDHYSGYMWVAALDWHTCLICGSLDGRIFDGTVGMELFSKGSNLAPDLPVHTHCRCVMVPVLKGMEDDYTKGAPTYKDWLARQPENRLIDILGPSKYAAYKNGMPIERFVKIGRFSKDSKVLTLEELKLKSVTRNQLLKGDGSEVKPEKTEGQDTAAAANIADIPKKPQPSAAVPKPEQEVSKTIEIEDAVNAKLSELRKWGKETKRERAVIISDDGTYLGKRDGGKDFVKIQGKILDILKNQPDKSVVFLHNHPSSSSFSLEDFDVMGAYPSIKEMRIIGHNGNTYTMSIGYNNQRPSLEELEKKDIEIYIKHYKDIMQDYANKSTMRELPKGMNAFKYYLTERNKLLADEYGWIYKEGTLNG